MSRVKDFPPEMFYREQLRRGKGEILEGFFIPDSKFTPKSHEGVQLVCANVWVTDNTLSSVQAFFRDARSVSDPWVAELRMLIDPATPSIRFVQFCIHESDANPAIRSSLFVRLNPTFSPQAHTGTMSRVLFGGFTWLNALPTASAHGQQILAPDTPGGPFQISNESLGITDDHRRQIRIMQRLAHDFLDAGAFTAKHKRSTISVAAPVVEKPASDPDDATVTPAVRQARKTIEDMARDLWLRNLQPDAPNLFHLLSLPLELIGNIVDEEIVSAIAVWNSVGIHGYDGTDTYHKRFLIDNGQVTAVRLPQVNQLLRAECKKRYWVYAKQVVRPRERVRVYKELFHDLRTERDILEDSQVDKQDLLGYDGWDLYDLRGNVRCLCRHGSWTLENFPAIP